MLFSEIIDCYQWAKRGFGTNKKKYQNSKIWIMILHAFRNVFHGRHFILSGDEVEFQVNDRRSFEEFVGLGAMNDIPDATTVAFFRERLRNANVIDELF